MGGGSGAARPLGNADAVDDVVLLDLLHHVEAVDDLAEDGVHAVQMPATGIVQDDEELAAAGVLARMRHREGANLVRLGIPRGLALDLVARASGADARIAGRQIPGEGIAALN